MKTKYFIAAVILFMAGSLFIGCDNNRENIKDAKENVNEANQDLREAKAQYANEWQQFKTDAELKISENEKRISDFKTSIKTLSGKSKAKYQEEVTELEKKTMS